MHAPARRRGPGRRPLASSVLALLLAAPANRIFLVGDDDQSIYGWRLADVRRVLAIGEALPGLRRVDLEVNHRCPAPVVERAVRLIEHNHERFAKVIRAARRCSGGGSCSRRTRATSRSGPLALLRSWPDDGGTRAVLARTNRELRPAVLAAMELGLPFRAPSVELLVDDPRLDDVLDRVDAETPADLPLLVRLGRFRSSLPAEPWLDRELAAALLAWAPPYRDVQTLRAAIEATRARLAELRRDDARLVAGDRPFHQGCGVRPRRRRGDGGGPVPERSSRRRSRGSGASLRGRTPAGYVAWTRARRTLTLSYDPAVPSPFLLEAFTADELGVVATTTSAAWNRLISRISRSIESRNGSVTSGGKASRTESFGP